MKVLIKKNIDFITASTVLTLLVNSTLVNGAPSSSSVALPAMTSTFTYQGRLLNTDATAPLSDIIDFSIGIYDPTGTCLIYEEAQSSIDVTNSDGVFAIAVGSDQGSSKRTGNDPGLTMAQVFSNLTKQELVPPSSLCPLGYTPSVSDQRTFRVSVRPHSTDAYIPLKPDLTINSVPYAKVAETFQGLIPDEFIQVSNPVTQKNVETLLNQSDASSFHNHDTQYVRKGKSISMNPQELFGLGAYSSTQQSTLTTGLGSADSGKVWYNSTSKQMYFWDGTTAQLVSTASGGISVNARFAGNGSPANPLDLALTGVTAGNNYTKFNVDTYGRISSATQISSSDVTTALGYTPVNKAGDAVTGTLTVNPSSDAIASIVKGAAGQTNDLTQWQNSAGTVLAKMDKLGNLTTAGLTTPGITISGFGTGVVQSTSGVLSISSVATSNISAVTASRALASDASGYMSASATTATELGYLSGVTSAVQTQINGKEPTITAGTTAQYWRGDKSWQSFNTDVRAALSGTAPINYAPLTGVISISQAATAANGYLSSTDWNTFNNKLGTTLNSAQIFVGNGSNVATGVAMSGDATISNTGALTLANSGATAGTYTKVTVDAKGRVTAGSNMAGSDVTTALGYTPVNKAGDTMTGGLTVDGGAGVLSLKPGALDHSYIQFYGRTASPGTRSGWFGIGGAASTTFAVTNEMSNGLLQLSTTGATGHIALMPGGNVGIGTANPTSKLMISTTNDTSFNPAAWSAAHTVLASDGTKGIFVSYNQTTNTGQIATLNPNVAWGHTVLQPISGNVGIGTTAPNAKLEVNGTVRFSSLNSVGYVKTNGSGDLSTGTITSAEIAAGLGYTPVNKAGDSMSGALTVSSGNLTVSTGNLVVTSGTISGIGSVPSGAVMAFNLSACPPGWSVFNNAQGRVIVGASVAGVVTQAITNNKDANNVNLTDRNLNTTGGELVHTLTTAEIPAHNHGFTDNYYSENHGANCGWAGSSDGYDWDNCPFGTGSNTSNAGGGGSHSVVDPYVALLYCSKN